MLHGYPAMLVVMTLLLRLLWPRRRGLALAAQALLLMLALAAVGRSVVVHPGYVVAVVCCVGWLMRTKELSCGVRG